MRGDTMEAITVIVFAALVILVVTAIIKNNRTLGLFTVVLLELLVVFREIQISWYARSIFGALEKKGELAEGFIPGAKMVIEYTDWTGYFVYAALLAVTVLYIRSSRK